MIHYTNISLKKTEVIAFFFSLKTCWKKTNKQNIIVIEQKNNSGKRGIKINEWETITFSSPFY